MRDTSLTKCILYVNIIGLKEAWIAFEKTFQAAPTQNHALALFKTTHVSSRYCFSNKVFVSGKLLESFVLYPYILEVFETKCLLQRQRHEIGVGLFRE